MLHDLQTPVAVLDASMRLLAEDLGGADTELLETLRDAQRACCQIRQYVDHFVSSELLGEGDRRTHRKRFDLGGLLSELLRDYSPHAEAAGASVSLDVSGTLRLCADEILLRRVFQNLVENALRHLSGERRLSITATRSSVVEVRVRSDGPPLRTDGAKSLFEKRPPFPSDRSAGLALYICRSALSTHGGTITVEDDPAFPVCFLVRLPIASI